MDTDDDDALPPDLVPLDADPAAVAAAAAAARARPPRRQQPGGRDPVPVTLITGALGAGKTTLVNHILTASHGLKFAVVLNEAAADAGIEDALVAAAARAAGADAVTGDAWVKLANGCLCCSVKSDFLAALEALAARADGDGLDAILVETSGLADPGPAAATLWADDALESGARLDGVVTVVDAARFRRQLADPRPDGAVREVALQVCYADVILLNKVDAAGEGEAAAAEGDARSLNPGATIVRCERGRVDPARLLRRGTLDADRAARAATAAATAAAVGGGGAAHAHDQGIATHAWRAPPGAVDEAALRGWLESVLWGDRTPPRMDVYRLKALLPLRRPTAAAADGDRPPSPSSSSSLRRAVVQAVADTYEVVDCGPWEEEGEGGGGGRPPVVGRAVAIGRHLDAAALERGLAGAVVVENA